jgi:hypothetical protein
MTYWEDLAEIEKQRLHAKQSECDMTSNLVVQLRNATTLELTDQTEMYSGLCGQAADEIERLRAALCMLYDKWENGDPCSDDAGVFVGNAFRLTQAEEDSVLALIPSEREADQAAQPDETTGEQK